MLKTLQDSMFFRLATSRPHEFRAEYVWPWSGRCLGRKATEWAMKPWEVDLSLSKGFHLRFTPKMRRCVTCNWPDDIWKLNVCAFLLRQKSKLNLFTLFLSDYEQRSYTKIDNMGWPKKTKACLNLELITAKEIYIQWPRFTFDKHFVPKLWEFQGTSKYSLVGLRLSRVWQLVSWIMSWSQIRIWFWKGKLCIFM